MADGVAPIPDRLVTLESGGACVWGAGAAGGAVKVGTAAGASGLLPPGTHDGAPAGGATIPVTPLTKAFWSGVEGIGIGGVD